MKGLNGSWVGFTSESWTIDYTRVTLTPDFPLEMKFLEKIPYNSLFARFSAKAEV